MCLQEWRKGKTKVIVSFCMKENVLFSGGGGFQG